MKNSIKNTLYTGLLLSGLLLTSCGKGSNEQGTQDAQEANGDTYGTEAPADNMNSGSTGTETATDPTATDGAAQGTTQTDTVTGTTTNGNKDIN